MLLRVFSGLLLWMSASFVLANIQVYDFSNQAQEEQFKELSQTLRCPKCQNNNISDSTSDLAKDIRFKVYQMTKDGQSKTQIVDYMKQRYGNFVTYEPPFAASTLILWLGPLFVLLFGFFVLWARVKGAKKNKENQWDESKEKQLKALFDDTGNHTDSKEGK